MSRRTTRWSWRPIAPRTGEESSLDPPAIASAAATSEARSYEVSGTARAWNILCGNGRGGQLDPVEKGTGVIGTHHLSLATRTARIRARLAIAGSRYGLQLEGERAMATGEPRAEKE